MRMAGRMMTNREVGIFEEYWDKEFCGSFGGGEFQNLGELG